MRKLELISSAQELEAPETELTIRSKYIKMDNDQL